MVRRLTASGRVSGPTPCGSGQQSSAMAVSLCRYRRDCSFGAFRAASSSGSRNLPRCEPRWCWRSSHASVQSWITSAESLEAFDEKLSQISPRLFVRSALRMRRGIHLAAALVSALGVSLFGLAYYDRYWRWRRHLTARLGTFCLARVALMGRSMRCALNAFRMAALVAQGPHQRNK